MVIATGIVFANRRDKTARPRIVEAIPARPLRNTWADIRVAAVRANNRSKWQISVQASANPTMTVGIAQLPRIVETLSISGKPQFVVLYYNEFVRLAAAAPGRHAPDIVSVLDHGDEHLFVILTSDSHRMYISTLDISGEVDEAHYLDKHKDVKAAIEQGRLRSGTQHYLRQGYFERREVRFRTLG